MVAIAGRFAARAEYFKGAGYGLDDWGILFCGVLLAAITIVGHLSKLCASGFGYG